MPPRAPHAHIAHEEGAAQGRPHSYDDSSRVEFCAEADVLPRLCHFGRIQTIFKPDAARIQRRATARTRERKKLNCLFFLTLPLIHLFPIPFPFPTPISHPRKIIVFRHAKNLFNLACVRCAPAGLFRGREKGLLHLVLFSLPSYTPFPHPFPTLPRTLKIRFRS